MGNLEDNRKSFNFCDEINKAKKERQDELDRINAKYDKMSRRMNIGIVVFIGVITAISVICLILSNG